MKAQCSQIQWTLFTIHDIIPQQHSTLYPSILLPLALIIHFTRFYPVCCLLFLCPFYVLHFLAQLSSLLITLSVDVILLPLYVNNIQISYLQPPPLPPSPTCINPVSGNSPTTHPVAQPEAWDALLTCPSTLPIQQNNPQDLSNSTC